MERSSTQKNYDHVVRGEKSSISVVDQRSFIDSRSGSACIHLEEDEHDISAIDVTVACPSQEKKKPVFLPGVKVTAEVVDVERAPRTHPFNPNLYTIKLSHGNFCWEIRRRYKHFLKLDAELFLHRVNHDVRHAARRQSRHLQHLPSRHLPKRPDMFATTQKLEKRKKCLEKYLQTILDNSNYLNHKETLYFLEVSPFSFQRDLGDKGREGILRKRAGGHRFPAGCCSCCSSLSWGLWDKRWLLVKDSFIAYLSPRDKEVRGVVLMDKDFTFTHGRKQTGVRNGLLVQNQSRQLLLTCWTERKTREWMKAIIHVMATKGSEWTEEHPHGSYAPVRQNTVTQWFVDGESYFDAVAGALEAAEEEIFLAGWWISPELYLRRPITAGHEWRLDNVLKRKAEAGVKIFILVYKEVELALSIDSAYTKAKLVSLHSNIKVLRHPDHITGAGVVRWAHHEKLVVIDQKVAFIGGLDLCFGRWDNSSHPLTDFGSVVPPQAINNTEKEIRKIGALIVEGALNGIILPTSSGLLDGVEIEPGTRGGSKIWIGKDYSNPIHKDFCDLHKPYEDSVDRGLVPRMPWHDVGMRMSGASARDVARHFILRWNAIKCGKVKMYCDIPFLLPKSYSTLDTDESAASNCTSLVDCQILRSVSEWSGGIPVESSIYTAYVTAIQEAKHFIYIENQFFISSLFIDNVNNEICQNLLWRIQRAHREGTTFKVIVVMPLLPAFEGEIGTATGRSIGIITHWNYRSICRGSQSLLERLEKLVGDTSKYISFYGLRTHSEMYGTPVTELVYVHSKMMIVDDKTVIIGSANINDRSLLGRRDSEIAAIMKDREFVSSTMDGKEYQAGKFAFSLRSRLFREHLGLLDSPPRSEEAIKDVVSDNFYKDLWMATARRNTEIYEEVFHCMPSDRARTLVDLNTIKGLKSLAKDDPGQARVRLRDVRGYLVELPLHFLENEDLRPPIVSSEYMVPTEVFT